VITIKDLQEAIAECKGERDPNANTCIKLAAYYTIMEHMQDNSMPAQKYSFAAGPPPSTVVDYQGTSEFAECARGMPLNDFMAVMDELMSTLQILNPKLYNSVIRRVSE
jgi:hypothetical protein